MRKRCSGCAAAQRHPAPAQTLFRTCIAARVSTWAVWVGEKMISRDGQEVFEAVCGSCSFREPLQCSAGMIPGSKLFEALFVVRIVRIVVGASPAGGGESRSGGGGGGGWLKLRDLEAAHWSYRAETGRPCDTRKHGRHLGVEEERRCAVFGVVRVGDVRSLSLVLALRKSLTLLLPKNRQAIRASYRALSGTASTRYVFTR